MQAGLKPTPLHNTCTGKHAAMLALCVHHGWPLADYLNPAHPVQELTLGTVARMVGFPKGQIQVAIDGCGAPVFYVPLKNIALGYARLAGALPESLAGILMAAILAHPRHIAGDGRLETTVMEALPGKIFAKSGAEGGYGLSLTAGGLGVAFKIEDGSQRARTPPWWPSWTRWGYSLLWPQQPWPPSGSRPSSTTARKKWGGSDRPLALKG